jgi:thiamine biosynthesis lipoprotein
MAPREQGPPPLRKMILPALFVGGLFYVTFTRTPEVPAQAVLSGEALGTTWTLKLAGTPDEARQAALTAVVSGALDEVDRSMSTYRDDSEIMMLNAADGIEPVPLSPMLGRVLGEALDVGVASSGAFDVTVGPLVNAFGFGPDKRRIVPEATVLEALAPRVGQDKLELTEGGLTKAHPGVFIDLSAIAKGYAVDLVVERLEAEGEENLLMEVGGEIVARGLNPQGTPWRLGIERPAETERTVHQVVALKDAAMATSGDYRQYYEVDGQRVSHLIDPRTAEPITHTLASVTVIATRCATADAWATALSILGPDEGVARAEAMRIPAYFIVRTDDGGFESRSTSAFEALP